MTADITGVVCGQVVFQNNAEGARLYGCGGSFTGLHDFIVCADCGMAMHLACFRKHCQSDLAAALRSAEQASARVKALETGLEAAAKRMDNEASLVRHSSDPHHVAASLVEGARRARALLSAAPGEESAPPQTKREGA